MNYKYVIHIKAQEDYEAALEWYSERSFTASENFINAIEEGLMLICDNPLRWRNLYKNFYEFVVKKYPFTIIYTIEPENKLVVIVAVYHHKRKPNKKYRK